MRTRDAAWALHPRRWLFTLQWSGCWPQPLVLLRKQWLPILDFTIQVAGDFCLVFTHCFHPASILGPVSSGPSFLINPQVLPWLLSTSSLGNVSMFCHTLQFLFCVSNSVFHTLFYSTDPEILSDSIHWKSWRPSGFVKTWTAGLRPQSLWNRPAWDWEFVFLASSQAVLIWCFGVFKEAGL
jgi:hypothetical protein